MVADRSIFINNSISQVKQTAYYGGMLAIIVLLLFLRDTVLAIVRGLSQFFAFGTDRKLIDSLAFDGLCDALRDAGRETTRTQNGYLPGYLRVIALGAVLLGLLVFWLQ